MGDLTFYHRLTITDANTGEMCDAIYGRPMSPLLAGLVFDIVENEWHDLYFLVGDDHYAHKWYTHEDDLRAASREYPDVVFCLHGRPEYAEPADVWRLYVQNGRTLARHHPTLVWPDPPQATAP